VYIQKNESTGLSESL